MKISKKQKFSNFLFFSRSLKICTWWFFGALNSIFIVPEPEIEIFLSAGGGSGAGGRVHETLLKIGPEASMATKLYNRKRKWLNVSMLEV